MPASGLTPERAKQLKDQGWSHAKIAEEYDVTVSTVASQLRAGGYTRPQLSHKSAIPWTVARKHQQHRVMRYLRELSTLSQGHQRGGNEVWARDAAHTAIRWANSVLDRGRDISYDEFRGPIEIKADPDNWHLKKLMQRVITAQTKKL